MFHLSRYKFFNYVLNRYDLAESNIVNCIDEYTYLPESVFRMVCQMTNNNTYTLALDFSSQIGVDFRTLFQLIYKKNCC